MLKCRISYNTAPNVKFCFKLGRAAAVTFECSRIVYGDETLKNKVAVYDCFKNSVVNRNRYYRKQ